MRALYTLSLATLVLAACADSGDVTAPSAAPLNSATAADSPDDVARVDARSDSDAGDASTRTYRVTIMNLTTGQPLSPGVVVTHTRRASLFSVGEPASEGIRQIAENGDPSVAAAALTGAAGVFSVVSTTAPVGILEGMAFPSSLSFEITAGRHANRLSMSLMLICTNDGFAGLDGVRLPGGYRERVYYAAGYDAGTEVNTEVASSIVPPCFGIGPVQGPVGGTDRTPEGGTIRHHAGITGAADLTSLHDWEGPVARVTVQRIK